MTDAAIIFLSILGLALAVATILLRRSDPVRTKAEQAMSDDERRLAATTDPKRREKLQRRIDSRKGQ